MQTYVSNVVQSVKDGNSLSWWGIPCFLPVCVLALTLTLFPQSLSACCPTCSSMSRLSVYCQGPWPEAVVADIDKVHPCGRVGEQKTQLQEFRKPASPAALFRRPDDSSCPFLPHRVMTHVMSSWTVTFYFRPLRAALHVSGLDGVLLE